MKAQGLSAAAIAKALGIGRERLTTEADRQQAVWRGRSMRRMSLLTEVGVNKVSLVYWEWRLFEGDVDAALVYGPKIFCRLIRPDPCWEILE